MKQRYVHMSLCNNRQDTPATHCNTLQHTATHCNTLQHTATHCYTVQHTLFNTLQHTATHCNTLQHTAAHADDTYQGTEIRSTATTLVLKYITLSKHETLQHPATPSNTRQHTTPCCTTPCHTATHCNTLQHTATLISLFKVVVQRATPCNRPLQHTRIVTKAQYNADSARQSRARQQYTATHCCNTLQHSRATLQHAATRCNTLQHAATHCTTL